MQTDKRFITFYFLFAAFTSIFAYLAPLYYLNLGFSEVQIGILASLFSLAALSQPIFGILADAYIGRKKIMIINFFVVLICTILLYVCSSFLAVAFLILVYSTFLSPTFGITDIFITSYTEKYQKNYGLFRQSKSIGKTIGIIICLPFIMVFGISGFLICNFLLISIMLIMVRPLEYSGDNIKNKADTNFKKDLLQLFKNKKYLALIIFGALYFGAYKIRLTYQSIKIHEINDSPIFIVLIIVFMTVPEILFLPYCQKLKHTFSFYQLMTFVVSTSIISLLIFAIGDSIFTLLISGCLNGIVCAIFFTTMTFKIRDAVDPNVMVSARLVYGMVIGGYSTILTLAIITPAFAIFGVSSVFLMLAIFITLAYIPLQFIKKF